MHFSFILASARVLTFNVQKPVLASHLARLRRQTSDERSASIHVLFNFYVLVVVYAPTG